MRQLRMVALELPETEERKQSGTPAFAVRGKGFVSVTKGGNVHLWLSSTDVDEVIAARPQAEPLSRSGKVIGVAIPLAEVNGKDLRELVRKSWTVRAPKRLAAAQAASERGEGGDLPTSIGRPAIRALHAAGLATLERVASQSEVDLLALHGVGPRAVRILSDALADQGRSLRD